MGLERLVVAGEMTADEVASLYYIVHYRMHYIVHYLVHYLVHYIVHYMVYYMVYCICQRGGQPDRHGAAAVAVHLRAA